MKVLFSKLNRPIPDRWKSCWAKFAPSKESRGRSPKSFCRRPKRARSWNWMPAWRRIPARRKNSCAEKNVVDEKFFSRYGEKVRHHRRADGRKMPPRLEVRNWRLEEREKHE